MADAALVFIVILIAIVAPVGLYLLVRAEHDRREVMDRRRAERAARRDANEGGRAVESEPNADGDEWNTDGEWNADNRDRAGKGDDRGNASDERVGWK